MVLIARQCLNVVNTLPCVSSNVVLLSSKYLETGVETPLKVIALLSVKHVLASMALSGTQQEYNDICVISY